MRGGSEAGDCVGFVEREGNVIFEGREDPEGKELCDDAEIESGTSGPAFKGWGSLVGLFLGLLSLIFCRA